MDDKACVAFLHWALPRLGLRWQGFRRVRRQVCKRVARRLHALDLGDVAAYRAHLESDPEEWRVLDGLCRITISRFWRDAQAFEHLGHAVLPELARAAAARGKKRLRAWSAGCASGEEPYSLSLAWALMAAPLAPLVTFAVVATDTDAHMIERARAARYPASSLEHLPPGWRARAFRRDGASYVLRPAHRAGVTFERRDIRDRAPRGRFDLVLCRNLAFTYFAEDVQAGVLRRITSALAPGGALAIGARERLPEEAAGLIPWPAEVGVYRKAGGYVDTTPRAGPR